MKPYHPNNLKHQPYSPWRVIILAWAGKILGVQFKIDGIPYGGAYKSREQVDDVMEAAPGGTGG